MSFTLVAVPAPANNARQSDVGRLIEAMEAAGVVSPPEHNGDRSVLAPPPPK